MMKKMLSAALVAAALYAAPAHAVSAPAQTCASLPNHDALKKMLIEARQQDNGGLNLDMWGSIVDRSGKTCAVAFTGETEDSQWPGSRIISAQKANTANGFSLKGLALSTANLYSAVQPGGSLFGLQESNPVNAAAAYEGDTATYGSAKDPLVGKKIGGVNVFGGGLALYDAKGVIVGALGVSGDTSCADHNIAWRLRSAMKLDFVPKGVSADGNDQIIYDLEDGKSKGGYGHPTCGGKEADVAATLPASSKVDAPKKAD
ncbi:MAG: heme-binding protein [Micavibrio sp.]|nr:heme-binding protein [Micavibrio sp.]